MRIIIITFTLVLFGTSLSAGVGEEKYEKVVSIIEKYYYKPLSKDEIINKGVNAFLKSTSILSPSDKKKINTKFNFYDKNYGEDTKEGVHKKIKTIINFLLEQMFSKEEIYDILIHSTMESLDAHSSYLDKKNLQELKIQIKGVFGGLGIAVGKKEKKLIVVSPFDDTPAFNAGIKAGDVILNINGFSCENMSIDKAVSLMRGKVKTSINLTIERKGEIIPITIIRGLITIKSVYCKNLPNDILYLRISAFDKQVVKNVSSCIEENTDANSRIILDLRNNPGGLLDQAVGLADVFMNRGIIVTQKARHSRDDKTYSASKKNTVTNTPLVVLINSGSASASEIVSGSLQTHHRATVFGERSFGKGTVQVVIPINNDEAIKLTMMKFFLADGSSINNIGIKPDYQIEADMVDKKDIALQATEDYLNNQNLFNKRFFAQAYGPEPYEKRFKNKDIIQKDVNKDLNSSLAITNADSTLGKKNYSKDPEIAKLQKQKFVLERKVKEKKNSLKHEADLKKQREVLEAQIAFLEQTSGGGGVDDIPKLLKHSVAVKKDATKWLFIVAIENYDFTDPVAYSAKSARDFKAVMKKRLGIPEKHIRTLINSGATAGKIRYYMQDMLSHVKKGDTIYFYYSGHGVPVASQKNAPYMLAQDMSPDYVGNNKNFKLQKIYKDLSNSKASKVVAFIDSCFSGGADNIALFKGVAATRLKPKRVTFDKSKMLVISAGSGTQYSNKYDEKSNRLFSYYVMRGLIKNNNNTQRLYDYVKSNVQEKSYEMGASYEQVPVYDGNIGLKL